MPIPIHLLAFFVILSTLQAAIVIGVILYIGIDLNNTRFNRLKINLNKKKMLGIAAASHIASLLPISLMFFINKQNLFSIHSYIFITFLASALFSALVIYLLLSNSTTHKNSNNTRVTPLSYHPELLIISVSAAVIPSLQIFYVLLKKIISQ